MKALLIAAGLLYLVSVPVIARRDAVLTPQSGGVTISGQVVTNDTGEPVVGATVRALSVTGRRQTPVEAVTDAGWCGETSRARSLA